MIYHDTYHHRIYYKENETVLSELFYKVLRNELYIDSIITKVEHRRKGYGTQLIKELINYTDKHISLLALPLEDGYDYEKLINYYKKLGFKHDKRYFEPNYLVYENH